MCTERALTVPIAAFSEDGLSLIATKLGKPIMLDSYTSSMCLDSWGRSSYARALIEIDATVDLKESLDVAIMCLQGGGYTKETVHVEYEWKPPRCCTCNVFGHQGVQCPKYVKPAPMAQNEEGFVNVGRKNGKGKHVEGIRLTKPKPSFVYRVKQQSNPQGASNVASPTNVASTSNSSPMVSLKNSFDVLRSSDDLSTSNEISNVGLEVSKKITSHDDEVEEVYDEYATFVAQQEKTTNDVAVTKQVGNLPGGGPSLYSQFKQQDYSDNDEYDDYEEEISEAQREFCKAMNISLRRQARY